MEYIKKNKLTIAGIITGAIAGFLYWNFIGCASGTCAITSNPYNSTIYGSVMGGLLFSMFQPEEKKQAEKTE
ncbi:MAG TPA: DUF6132 family protein [Saprospiraceae bacterium]|nr:hypothetical protein [Saprospiraceae bacterium]HRO07790.1 DUF6132 family protein [Saprospiraceae bacterium]HRO74370.1 DUF6132 family protein [Saprospiraceae bacterium]HRP40984.1 DUF6132 family protein [Saprospiraceae bacterium]